MQRKQDKQTINCNANLKLFIAKLHAKFFLSETHDHSISSKQLTLVWPQRESQEMNVVSCESYEPYFCLHPHWFSGQQSATCGSTIVTTILKSTLTVCPPDLAWKKEKPLRQFVEFQLALIRLCFIMYVLCTSSVTSRCVCNLQITFSHSEILRGYGSADNNEKNKLFNWTINLNNFNVPVLPCMMHYILYIIYLFLFLMFLIWALLITFFDFSVFEQKCTCINSFIR